MNDETGFTINPKLYDFLKYIALVILPAMAALILGLGVLLNWTPAPIVAGVVTLVDTFLGTILGKSAANFKKQEPNVFGDLIVQQDFSGVPTGLRIVGHTENPVFEENGKVILNVKREQNLQ
jgi:hypothetical protein